MTFFLIFRTEEDFISMPILLKKERFEALNLKIVVYFTGKLT